MKHENTDSQELDLTKAHKPSAQEGLIYCSLLCKQIPRGLGLPIFLASTAGKKKKKIHRTVLPLIKEEKLHSNDPWFDSRQIYP